MIEAVTLAWSTGELLVSPFGVTEEDRGRLAARGFLLDPALDLDTAPWTPERHDLARQIHRLPYISLDPSPFAFLAGRRAEGLRRRLRQLEEDSGFSRELLAAAGWYHRGETMRLWRRELALLERVLHDQRPQLIAARCAALEKSLAELPDARDRHTYRWRWFYRERLRFERGEMADDPFPPC